MTSEIDRSGGGASASGDPNAAINKRIDDVLDRNKRSEQIVVGLSVAIFVLGVAIVAVSLALSSPAYLVPSAAIEACLYWPIRQVLRIRKENIALAAAPSLIATLPPEQAATEMVKLLEDVRG